jgi:hypothetical protein
MDFFITARFLSMPYENPVQIFFAIPDRLLLLAEWLFLYFCNILMASTIFFKGFSKSPPSLMNSNLNRCYLEYFNRLRLLI